MLFRAQRKYVRDNPLESQAPGKLYTQFADWIITTYGSKEAINWNAVLKEEEAATGTTCIPHYMHCHTVLLLLQHL